MERNSLPTEVIISRSAQSLGDINLDWMPQPGNYLNLMDKNYIVLERRHRYHLKFGRYQLYKIALYVQSAPLPTETSWIEGKLILGDANCRFNAHSELIRCAVNPMGACGGCRFFERR